MARGLLVSYIVDRGVIATATELFEARHYPGVVAMCTDALEDEPECVPLLLIRARAHIGLRRDLDAQSDLREIIRLDPQCALAYRLLGELAARRDENESAAIFFREALRLDPGDREAADWLLITDASIRPAAAVSTLPSPAAAAGRVSSSSVSRVSRASRPSRPSPSRSAAPARAHERPSASGGRFAHGTQTPGAPEPVEAIGVDGIYDERPTKPFARVVVPDGGPDGAPDGVPDDVVELTPDDRRGSRRHAPSRASRGPARRAAPSAAPADAPLRPSERALDEDLDALIGVLPPAEPPPAPAPRRPAAAPPAAAPPAAALPASIARAAEPEDEIVTLDRPKLEASTIRGRPSTITPPAKPAPQLGRGRGPIPELPGFGEYLVQTGVLTLDRLRAAQAYQRSMRVQLSTAIVTLGLASPQRIEWASVAHQSAVARGQ